VLLHVVVVTWFHDGQVGYRDFSYRLQALAQRFRVTVLSRRALVEPELAIEGVSVVVLASTRRGAPELVRYWGAVLQWLRHHPADAVLHLGSHSAAVAGWPLHAPQAVYWNEHPTHYLSGPTTPGLRSAVKSAAFWLLRRLQYHGARRAALLMPIGTGQQRDLLRQGCHPSRLQLLAMGVTEDFSPVPTTGPIQPTPRANTALQLVYAGAIHPDRGCDLFIDALALARRQGIDVQLTLVGADAAQRAHCLARAASQGVPDALTVLSRLPGEHIPPLLWQADFGLCAWIDTPHYRVNPPTKLFEYFVAGLPVMASRIASHSEHVQDGVNGFLFDYDAPALAAVMAHAAASRASWPALREQALASGRAHRWSDIEPRFILAISQLLNPENAHGKAALHVTGGLLSMDVFDTALTRCWARPEHAHLACAEALRRAGLIELDASAWLAMRRQAEQRAVNRMGNDLARLQDIYALLAHQLGWTADQSAQAQHIECEVELTSVFPVASLRNWWASQDAARSMRCFLSDMYLPPATVQAMLLRCGYPVSPQQVWVSSDRGASKSSGQLYRQVLQSLEAEPTAKIHLGDNPHSDVAQAKRCGFAAQAVDAAALSRLEKRVAAAPSAPLVLRSLVAGALKAARVGMAAPLGDAHAVGVHAFGRDHAGPLLTLYVWWLLHDASQRRLTRLYFLSRDGQVLLEIARRLQAQGCAKGLELRYLYGSRQAWFAASLIQWQEDDLYRILDEPHDVFNTPAKLCKRLGFIDEAQLVQQWPEVRAACSRSTTNRELAQALVASVPAATALAHTQSLRQRVMGYLQQEGLFEQAAVGIVDLGWRGRLQQALGLIIEHGAPAVRLTAPRLCGYYIALLKAPQHDTAATLLDAAGGLPAPAHLMEMLCEADHGSTRGYRFADGVQPVFDAQCDPAIEAWGLKAYRQGVLDFANVFAQVAHLLPPSAHKRPAVAATFCTLARLWMHQPSPNAARAFARMPTTYSASHEGLHELAPPLPWADAWLRALTLGRWRLSGQHTPWLAGSLARMGTATGTSRALAAYGCLHDGFQRLRDRVVRRGRGVD
jgi:glycosyltransferase involved in cell wall biosynthesis/FMN phosphatase YigB (HAD superfamily)